MLEPSPRGPRQPGCRSGQGRLTPYPPVSPIGFVRRSGAMFPTRHRWTISTLHP